MNALIVKRQNECSLGNITKTLQTKELCSLKLEDKELEFHFDQ